MKMIRVWAGRLSDCRKFEKHCARVWKTPKNVCVFNDAACIYTCGRNQKQFITQDGNKGCARMMVLGFSRRNCRCREKSITNADWVVKKRGGVGTVQSSDLRSGPRAWREENVRLMICLAKRRCSRLRRQQLKNDLQWWLISCVDHTRWNEVDASMVTLIWSSTT
jgi:hypothetical protein